MTRILPFLLLLALPGSTSQQPAGAAVDLERMARRLEALSVFGATGDGGLERLAFSAQDRAAREWLGARLAEAGAQARTDAAGNLIARIEGREPFLPAIAFGSHIDSVPAGGRFDGNAGVLAALEVVEALAEAEYRPRHPLELVVFADEEASMVGSRAWAGDVTPDVLDQATHSGRTVAEGLAAVGGMPAFLQGARRGEGTLMAFLELHIEQGDLLEASGAAVGVVEGIVGIKWWEVTVDGEANHAGTTPMDRRRDALLAASEFVLAVNRIVTARSGRQVGTVGRIDAEPGAPNVVAGRVSMSLELRDLKMETIDSLFEEIRLAADAIGRRLGTEFGFRLLDATAPPAPTDPALQQLIENEARRFGLTPLRMPSGAGHDAQNVAAVAPIGMIFVPSRDGVSHSPAEFTSLEDLADGTRVLLGVILALDAQ